MQQIGTLKGALLPMSREGRVVSGRGMSTTTLAGRRELSNYFGSPPYPGSLNIVLCWPILLRPERAAVRLDVGLLWPATYEGRVCLAYRWHRCPLHILEIVSPHRFSASKGAQAIITFDQNDVAPLAAKRFIGWTLLWLRCRDRAYTDGGRYAWADRAGQRHPAYFAPQHLTLDPR